MFRVRAALVGLVMFLFVVVAAPTLVLMARGPRGRMEGFFGVVIGTGLISGLVWLCAPLLGAERPVVAGYIALGALAVFFPMCLLAAGLMRTCDYGEGPVGSHYLKSEPTPEAVGWADVEDEYAWLMVRLITALDPRIPTEEGLAARAKVNELLVAVAELPDYGRIARVSDGQSWRLFIGALDPQHCYSYQPEPREPGERFGLLVFLHGHGSNYLFMIHALRPLCDRLRLCLVAPSFGYGNWEAPGGVEAVERATRFGVAAFDADPARVFLGGLSQGGAGVSRTAVAHPDRYSGLIFISPTMELDVIGSEAFAEGWKGRPVLVIQGDRDGHVSPTSVTLACERMEANGVKLTQHRDPDAGHFLFLAKLDEMFEVIERWAKFGERGA
jgi:pimeloyl-ACP methyl ester carboxylesterase